jgi:hypothetical protein
MDGDPGIDTVAASDLGTQAWVGKGRPIRGRQCRQPNPGAGAIAKPAHGFFTSTWDPLRSTCPWAEFMHDKFESPGPSRSGAGRQLWTLVVHPEARLYVIDCDGDYDRLARAYPQYLSDALPPLPHWNQISSLAAGDQIDGVHVTAAAARPENGRLSGWGVESTLWFTWPFVGEPMLIASLREDWTRA